MIVRMSRHNWRFLGTLVLFALALPLVVVALIAREWLIGVIAALFTGVAARDLYDVWTRRARG